MHAMILIRIQIVCVIAIDFSKVEYCIGASGPQRGSGRINTSVIIFNGHVLDHLLDGMRILSVPSFFICESVARDVLSVLWGPIQ